MSLIDTLFRQAQDSQEDIKQKELKLVVKGFSDTHTDDKLQSAISSLECRFNLTDNLERMRFQKIVKEASAIYLTMLMLEQKRVESGVLGNYSYCVDKGGLSFKKNDE